MSEQLAVPTGRMTVEQFLDWAEPQPRGRFELLQGQVTAMAPERAVHFRTKLAAVNALALAVAAAGLPCEALPDGATVRISADTAFEPDAAINCGPRMADGDMVAPNPVMVLEVVSPGSRRIDTNRKLTEYFRVPSIRHYVILMTDTRVAVHHARGDDGAIHTRIVGEGELRLDPPGLAVSVGALFPA